MNTSELYEILIDKFSNNELIGELTLNGNCIIWSYIYDSNDDPIDLDEYDFDEDNNMLSTEDILNDVYLNDKDKIASLLDDLNMFDDWYFSDYDVFDKCISFKLF